MSGGAMEEACKNPWAMKYGLPNWMKMNVDRLHTSTDFEQYACSPPENDAGFLCEFDKKNPNNHREPEKNTNNPSTLKTSRSAPQLADQEFLSHLEQTRIRKHVPNAAALHLALPKDGVCSSAETTPTTTPQGSPYMIRKIREVLQEEGASKKWFHGARFEPKPLFTVSEESQADGSRGGNAYSRTAAPSASINNNKKYNISNFDINAVSPNSW